MSFTTHSSILLGALLLTFQSMATAQGAKINFNPSCDFKELTINIRKAQDINPDSVNLDIRLQPAARTQLTQISRNHMNQNLNMYINGIKINTAIIRAELNTESIRVLVDKRVAKKIFPSLLVTQCHPE